MTVSIGLYLSRNCRQPPEKPRENTSRVFRASGVLANAAPFASVGLLSLPAGSPRALPHRSPRRRKEREAVGRSAFAFLPASRPRAAAAVSNPADEAAVPLSRLLSPAVRPADDAAPAEGRAARPSREGWLPRPARRRTAPRPRRAVEATSP
jgi:hypothetical protein